jgi:PAS domain S-box-containing protein
VSEAERFRAVGKEWLDDGITWAIVALAPSGILLVDPDGHILLANRQAEEMFGYEPGELLSVEIAQLVPAHIRNLHRAHREAYIRDPKTRPMGSGLDLRARRKDDTTFPVEIALSPLDIDGTTFVVTTVRDITERVEAQRAIREIQLTLDAAREGVFLIDADTLQIAYANAGAAEQVQRSPDELTSMSLLDLNPNFDEPELRALLQPLIARRQPSLTIVTSHRRRDDAEVDVECVFQSPEVLREGERRSIVAFSRDITDRLEADRKLKEAEQVLSVLEDRERIARDLHDTVIQRLFAAGMSLQVAAAQAGPEVEGRVGSVVDELDATIRDIRQTIFRLTAHKLEPASLRRQIIDVVEQEAEILGFTPEVHFSGAVESVDDGRAEHLLAVLREALSNVGRHARASHADVQVDVGPELALTVRDDGIGMPSDATPGGGTANLRKRAEDLGGSIEIGPNEPRGTLVRWAVPIH